jgi:hypothetical protein
MSTLTLELSDALARRLDAASAARHISPAQLAREALEQALTTQSRGSNGEGKSLRELMNDAIGCVESGIGDLASNAKHMEGFGEWRK